MCSVKAFNALYNISLKQLKHCLPGAVFEIKHLVHDANKALGFALCYMEFWSVAVGLVLYFMYSTHGNALTNTYICIAT